MIKLPKTIKVGAHTFKVIFVESSSDINGNLAQMSYDENIIEISGSLSPSQQLTAFFHEICHAINVDFNETQCELIGNSFAQVLLDNKLLSTELTKSVK